MRITWVPKGMPTRCFAKVSQMFPALNFATPVWGRGWEGGRAVGPNMDEESEAPRGRVSHPKSQM